jgi:uncharacterized protein
MSASARGADWVPASGRATVWSACEFHRAYFPGFAPKLPYAVVLVRLEEGPRLHSNLIGCAFEDTAIGLRVHAVFEAMTDEVTLTKFRPIIEETPA